MVGWVIIISSIIIIINIIINIIIIIIIKYISLFSYVCSSVCTYVDAVAVCWNTDVSAKALQSIKEWTLGLLKVSSANFWARKPPREAPKRWT